MAQPDLLEEASDPNTTPERLRELLRQPSKAVCLAALRNPSLHKDLLEEASDPSTDPERLRELLRQLSKPVHEAAYKNPSLPEDVWRRALLRGEPEAWDNPMAPIYFLTWIPSKGDLRNIDAAACRTLSRMWSDPECCSSEGKALLAAKVQETWVTSPNAKGMMLVLGSWAKAKGKDSPEHREVVRILVLCLRTASLTLLDPPRTKSFGRFTDDDRQALDLLESWSSGGKDQRKKAKGLASSNAIKDAVSFAQDMDYLSEVGINKWAEGDLAQVIQTVLDPILAMAGPQEKDKHERLMADVIRAEMPLPPVVG
jgi:hypothetical protein